MPLAESNRQLVFVRAKDCCEYCKTQRRLIGMPLVVDHIVPQILEGSDELENLCAVVTAVMNSKVLEPLAAIRLRANLYCFLTRVHKSGTNTSTGKTAAPMSLAERG